MPSSPRRIPDLDDNSRLDSMTPPPSLVTTYSRSTLLSLATPDLPPPNPLRLQSFTPILRSSICDDERGVSEDLSTLLDGKPVSDVMPVHRHNKWGSEAAKSSSAGRPVSIRRNSGSSTSSSTERSPLPCHVSYAEQDRSPSGPCRIFEPLYISKLPRGFPASVNSSSSSLHIAPNGNLNTIGGARDSMTLGKELVRMRLGRRDSLEILWGAANGSDVSSDGEWGGGPVGKKPQTLARLSEQLRESMSHGRAKA
ncbi:uncharacterized protein IAS62_001939 [Cryptococcus decagattii]|uniref:Uncharacterized protein n=1 Tax=Cryptococcus decagattii TaxID=1859122 RepID=A0ABZ2AVT4_9TREE